MVRSFAPILCIALIVCGCTPHRQLGSASSVALQRIVEATVPIVIVNKKIPPPDYLKGIITGLAADKRDAERFLAEKESAPARRSEAQGLLIQDARTIVIPASEIGRMDTIEVPLPAGGSVRVDILGVDLVTHTAVLRLRKPLARTPLTVSRAPHLKPGDTVRGVGVPRDRVEAARRNDAAKPWRYGLVPVADYALVTAHVLKTGAPIDSAVRETAAVDRVMLPYTPVVEADGTLRGVIVAQLLDGGLRRWDGFSFVVEGHRLEGAIAYVKERLTSIYDLLGVVARTDIDPIAKQEGFKGYEALQVANTRPGSPARQAAIPAGALISHVDGTPVQSAEIGDLLRAAARRAARVTLTYIYGINGDRHDVTLRFAEPR